MATQLGMAVGFLVLVAPSFAVLRLSWLALGLMAVDLGVQGSFVANQARNHAIDPAARSRMSGQLFLTADLGAAACSAVIAAAWSRWGWPGTCGFALAWWAWHW